MRSFRFTLTAVLIWAVTASFAHSGQDPRAVEVERHAVEELTSRFLSSFENLDMKAFIACFAVERAER